MMTGACRACSTGKAGKGRTPGTPLFDFAILLRQQASLPAGFVQAVADGYTGAGGYLPNGWKPATRVMDRINLLELLSGPGKARGTRLASVRAIVQTTQTVAAHLPVVARVAADLANALRRGNKLLACGNGGSAADAQHLTGEWVGRFVRERRSYPAIALTAGGPLLTCLGSDHGYDEAFARQVRGLGIKGDVLVAFSTSGNSESVLRALQAAKQAGIVTVALLGRDGGRTRGVADHEIVVASNVTARIQEAHGLVVHLLCEETERLLGH